MYIIQFTRLAIIALLTNLILCQSNVTTISTPTTKIAATTLHASTQTTTLTSSSTITTVTSEAAKQLASTCTLNQASSVEKSLLNKVLALDKKKFTWQDKEHLYYFGVCTQAENAKNVNEAFVQINIQTKVQIVLGRLDDVDIEGFGTESKGIRVLYKHGDQYNNACNRAERKSVLYILCNPNNSSDVFEMIEENNNREDASCNYIFQLRTPLMCTDSDSSNKTMTTNSPSTVPAVPAAKANSLGFLGIILLVVFVVMLLYFSVGTAYMRYVKQARGIEQLPHHEVWHYIGSKSAGFFSYILRCGKVRSEVRNYEHINDRLSDDDENLLNM